MTAEYWTAVIDTLILALLVAWMTLDRLNVYWRRPPG